MEIFLKIHRETLGNRVMFLVKLQRKHVCFQFDLQNLLENKNKGVSNLTTGVFPVSFATFFKITTLQDTYERLVC